MLRRAFCKAFGAILAALLRQAEGAVEAERQELLGDTRGPYDRLGDTLRPGFMRLRYVGARAEWGVLTSTFEANGTFNSQPWMGMPSESLQFIGCSWSAGKPLFASFAAGSPFVQTICTDYDANSITAGKLTKQTVRLHCSFDFNTVFKEGEWEVMPSDMDWVDNRKFTDEELERWFDIPKGSIDG